MGAGSNPAVWFVAVTLVLTLARYWLDTKKEVPMKNKTTGRKTKSQTKSTVKRVLLAGCETIWGIAANLTVGLATLSIHAKGAPK